MVQLKYRGKIAEHAYWRAIVDAIAHRAPGISALFLNRFNNRFIETIRIRQHLSLHWQLQKCGPRWRSAQESP